MNPSGLSPFACLITRGEATSANYSFEKKKILETITGAIAVGVRVIQIREKRLPARLLFELVRDAVRVAEGSQASIVVNERADIAFAAGASGVHLPENSISPAAVRKAFGVEAFIGISTHSPEAAVAAAGGGADQIIFGPIFDTPGKQAVGLDQLKEACAGVAPHPVIAIGGIDETNVRRCLEAGAAGIAAIRALNDPAQRRSLMGELERVRIG